MKKPQLVIMAAGLGSRFGGLKQMRPVDEQGHLLIDFSIYDAMRAGFGEVVCIVKPELEQTFRETIGNRIGAHIPLRYAHQVLDRLPDGFGVPEGRTKPWGTAHALLCAAEAVDGPFAAINADDFYSRDAFEAIAGFLRAEHAPNEHAMVGYRIENTLTEHGSVARGVCRTRGGFLTDVVERTRIEPAPGGARYTEDGGGTWVNLPAGTAVSLNLWGFQRSMMDEIIARFPAWLDANLPVNPLGCEYFLPWVPSQLIAEHAASFEVLSTHARWYGVTYRDDLPRVCEAIAALKAEGLYPERLWG
ncbi:MAG: sugar phosphate nucleotidyltransferase [Christensenellaceae bacterium]|nr:sugar phosphate nucleotidyltransferase [Christensenellaceae bacterium]MEA5066748.1 sugar phosphate nucleotidyltransferase [Eubacteriales bacterium]MEA5070035.1 sugar phosphate nucleotidyltransferase [Christensenellaceae bacterium]